MTQVLVSERRPLGQVIRATRRRRKLTVVDVAARCNVTRGIVHVWERQDYILPKNLPALAKALNVPVAVLFEANGTRQPKRKKSHRVQFSTYKFGQGKKIFARYRTLGLFWV